MEKWLSKDWPTLKAIDLCELCGILGKNEIGYGGLSILLSRAPKDVEKLQLGTPPITQAITALAANVFITFSQSI